MSDNVSENQEFIILSKAVTNATKCKVTNVFDDEFVVKLTTKETYKENMAVELFSVVKNGILYFSTKLNKAEDCELHVCKPSKTSLIQRREYTRIDIHKNILISHENKNIRAEIIDISAGGMKILTDSKMKVKGTYTVNINLEKKVNFSCIYSPIRIVFDDSVQKYRVSGKFKVIKNIDKISLAQFCMKKQSELESK